MSYTKFGKCWACSQPRKQKCISDTPLSWNRKVEGSHNHIGTDGSLTGVSGGHAAWWLGSCAAGPRTRRSTMVYMCGTMLAELEEQRTVKRAESWAFAMALSGLIGPSTIHTDSVACWMACGGETLVMNHGILGLEKVVTGCCMEVHSTNSFLMDRMMRWE